MNFEQELDNYSLNESNYAIYQCDNGDLQSISIEDLKWRNNENLNFNSLTENSELMELNISPVLREKKANQKMIIIEPSKTINIPTYSSTKLVKKTKVFKITKDLKKNKHAGRKRKNCMGGKHSKFCYDNMTRKLKSKLFDAILTVLNSSIKETEKSESQNNLEKNNNKPFFLKITQDIIKDINANSNQNLLKSQLKDIFSNNVCKKVENYGFDFNKKLIEKIYREKTQTKTISILERTFFDCLEHFRGTIKFKELEGLKEEYQNVINKFKENGETKEYIELFEEFVNRFEVYYEKKIARPSKKKK